MSETTTYRLPGFYKKAPALRKSFEARFDYSSAKTASPFVWDYWHVQEKYTLLRTPAYLFFPKKLYDDFHNQLVWWGRRTLGCHDVSPTWLSCYVDGCEQKIHSDLPHGPWAFVYSLTKWQTRKFLGGETFILNDRVLNYWANYDKAKPLENTDAFEKVPANFNQLLVFDPRRPHGVNRVSGVSDIKQGRLVIHGWFVNPRPFIQGAISTKELAQQISKIDEFVFSNSELVSGVTGTISFQIAVAPTGKIKSVRILASTLKNVYGDSQAVSLMTEEVRRHIGASFSFKKQNTSTVITLPLIFE